MDHSCWGPDLGDGVAKDCLIVVHFFTAKQHWWPTFVLQIDLGGCHQTHEKSCLSHIAQERATDQDADDMKHIIVDVMSMTPAKAA